MLSPPYNIRPKANKLIKGISDSELCFISSLKEGDLKSFSLLHKLYSPALLGIISRLIKNHDIAEDILQLSYIKIWKSISLYDPSKGRLFTWMAKVTKNMTLDHFRSSESLKNAKTCCIDDVSDNIEALYFITYNPETIYLKQYVSKLIPNEIKIIELIYFQGYTHTGAAEELGIPLGTVKTQIRSAIFNLRKLFSEN